MTNYFNYELTFNGLFSRNNLPGIKVGVYIINLCQKSLFSDRNTTVYFDSFGIEYFVKKYETKSEINQLVTTYLEYKIMNLLCVDFIASLL